MIDEETMTTGRRVQDHKENLEEEARAEVQITDSSNDRTSTTRRDMIRMHDKNNREKKPVSAKEDNEIDKKLAVEQSFKEERQVPEHKRTKKPMMR